MYLYLIFILLLAGSFLEIFDSKRQGTAQIIYYLTLSILFLLSFLRWERGTDWSGYYDYFSNIYDLDFSNNFENGFIFLNYCIHYLFNSYTVLLFILAAIQYFFISKAIRYLSIYPVLSLLCYFSVTKGGIFFVRQYIALAILMYSIRYVIEKKIYERQIQAFEDLNNKWHNRFQKMKADYKLRGDSFRIFDELGINVGLSRKMYFGRYMFEYFDKERLLSCPYVYHAEETKNGIEIQLYENLMQERKLFKEWKIRHYYQVDKAAKEISLKLSPVKGENGL